MKHAIAALLVVASMAASAKDPAEDSGHVSLGTISTTTMTPEMLEQTRTADHSWHVLSVAENGTVTLLKGLTKHEADYSAARLQGLPATPAEVKQDSKDKAAAALAEKVASDREDAYLRKMLPVCPEESDRKEGDPVWDKWLKTSKWTALGDSQTVNGCHEKGGTIHEWGWSGGVSMDMAGVYVGATIVPERPWTRHADMKLVEVFQ